MYIEVENKPVMDLHFIKKSTVFMYLPISVPHRLWDATGLENCYLPINVAA